MRHAARAGIIVAGFLGLLLAGCGGGGRGGGSAPTGPTGSQTGRAVFTVVWPDRSSTRLIPAAANSIRIRFFAIDKPNDSLLSTVIARPENGNTTSVPFEGIVVGNYIVEATAHPDASAADRAQASARVGVTVTTGETANITLTMVSTINRLQVMGNRLSGTVSPFTLDLPAALDVDRPNTEDLTVTALNANNEVVMITPGKIIWTSSDTEVVSLNPGTGTTVRATARKATRTRVAITVTDQESGVSSRVEVAAHPVVTLSSSPEDTIVAQGDTRTVTATVAGASTNTGVKMWTVTKEGSASPPAGTGLDPIAGTNMATFTAPRGANASGRYIVRATSEEDPSAVGTIVFTVSRVEVSIAPAQTTNLPQGGELKLTATVSGARDKSVTWQVVETDGGELWNKPSPPGGQTDPERMRLDASTATSDPVFYIAPLGATTEKTYTVRATSSADRNVSATATVRVPVVTVGISPAQVTVNRGRTQAFNSTASGAQDQRAKWRVVEPNGGTLSVAAEQYTSATITYTAPNTPGIYSVRADNIIVSILPVNAVIPQSWFAIATVTVPGVTIQPATATVNRSTATMSNTVQFTATVFGSSNSSVDWSVVDSSGMPVSATIGGSVNSNGTYTAPQNGGTFFVRATSTALTGESATAQVTVN